MTDSSLRGVFAPVITAFDSALNPDRQAWLAHCQWLLGQGVGLAIFGTNSEAASLSVAEKVALLEALLSSGVDGERLLPGTGACALTDTVSLSRRAVELGYAGVLMLPPFYYKGVSDDGLYCFYAEVIERVAENDLRIYLYHIPQVSQVPLSLALVERLYRDFPEHIAGIKDSSGDRDYLRGLNALELPGFSVFCGSEALLLDNMRQGGAGCISATANVNPAAICQLYEQHEEANAERVQESLDQIRGIFQGHPMIPALKAATAHYRGAEGWRRVRPPLLPLSDEEREALLRELAQAGFQMPDL